MKAKKNSRRQYTHHEIYRRIFGGNSYKYRKRILVLLGEIYRIYDDIGADLFEWTPDNETKKEAAKLIVTRNFATTMIRRVVAPDDFEMIVLAYHEERKLAGFLSMLHSANFLALELYYLHKLDFDAINELMMRIDSRELVTFLTDGLVRCMRLFSDTQKTTISQFSIARAVYRVNKEYSSIDRLKELLEIDQSGEKNRIITCLNKDNCNIKLQRHYLKKHTIQSRESPPDGLIRSLVEALKEIEFEDFRIVALHFLFDESIKNVAFRTKKNIYRVISTINYIQKRILLSLRIFEPLAADYWKMALQKAIEERRELCK